MKPIKLLSPCTTCGREESCYSVHICNCYKGWKEIQGILELLEMVDSPYREIEFGDNLKRKLIELREEIIKEYGAEK